MAFPVGPFPPLPDRPRGASPKKRDARLLADNQGAGVVIPNSGHATSNRGAGAQAPGVPRGFPSDESPESAKMVQPRMDSDGRGFRKARVTRSYYKEGEPGRRCFSYLCLSGFIRGCLFPAAARGSRKLFHRCVTRRAFFARLFWRGCQPRKRRTPATWLLGQARAFRHSEQPSL